MLNLRTKIYRFAIPCLLLILPGCESIDAGLAADVLRATGAALSGPDEQTVAAGLKEALQVGSERAVSSVSKSDGYLKNELIRIAMPEELESVAKGLRTVGFGEQVEHFEIKMNRAAEGAATEAKDVFWGAIRGMTLQDAYGILNGGDNAATNYFQERTSGELRVRYTPIVKQKMNEVGAYQSYSQLMDRYTALPFVKEPIFDFEGYVIDKALGGLFTTLAEEEARIRTDPAARTTELLRKVFSR